MAGLKKSKDKSSPNTILVVFLIFFVLLSIGLGVYAYYGYEGQEVLRSAKKNADKEAEKFKSDRNRYAVVATFGRVIMGNTPAPEDLTNFANDRDAMTKSPEESKDLKAAYESLHKTSEGYLGVWSEAEKKFPTTFPEVIKAAVDESKKNKALLEESKRDFEAFKANYNKLEADTKKSIGDLQAIVEDGNAKALAAAKVVNQKFPGLEKLLTEQQKANESLNKKMIEELADLQGQLTRSKNEFIALQQTMTNRGLGLATSPQGGGSGKVHALMLDISRGIPLWDKAIGKILRVDPASMTVQIDQGGKRGIQPEMTFNIFAPNPFGQADRSLKGTIEVVRVLSDNISTCKITSLYDDAGTPVPITGDRVRDVDNMLREGDLLFHTFFDMHVVIAGNVNYTGIGGDSPKAQQDQLEDFIYLLRRHNVHVDGYVDLMNGDLKDGGGRSKDKDIVTPKTRLLIVGTDGGLKADAGRVEKINAGRAAFMKEAVEQGLFVISAENFAAVIGYRPPSGIGSKDAPVYNFRPFVPSAGQNQIPQASGAPAAPAAPAPEMKKDEK